MPRHRLGPCTGRTRAESRGRITASWSISSRPGTTSGRSPARRFRVHARATPRRDDRRAAHALAPDTSGTTNLARESRGREVEAVRFCLDPSDRPSRSEPPICRITRLGRVALVARSGRRRADRSRTATMKMRSRSERGVVSDELQAVQLVYGRSRKYVRPVLTRYCHRRECERLFLHEVAHVFRECSRCDAPRSTADASVRPSAALTRKRSAPGPSSSRYVTCALATPSGASRLPRWWRSSSRSSRSQGRKRVSSRISSPVSGRRRQTIARPSLSAQPRRSGRRIPAPEPFAVMWNAGRASQKRSRLESLNQGTAVPPALPLP